MYKFCDVASGAKAENPALLRERKSRLDACATVRVRLADSCYPWVFAYLTTR